MSTESYVPDEAELIGCYAGAMEEHAGEDYATAKADAERGIAKIKADALREAVEEFESHVGAGEFEEQTCRNGTHWTHAVESWDHQGPFMHWLLNRADRIESGGGA